MGLRESRPDWTPLDRFPLGYSEARFSMDLRQPWPGLPRVTGTVESWLRGLGWQSPVGASGCCQSRELLQCWFTERGLSSPTPAPLPQKRKTRQGLGRAFFFPKFVFSGLIQKLAVYFLSGLRTGASIYDVLVPAHPCPSLALQTQTSPDSSNDYHMSAEGAVGGVGWGRRRGAGRW